MHKLARLATLAALCATPSLGADLTPEIDRALWCASAFYWLAGSAEDAGDIAEAEAYDAWSRQLLDSVAEALAGGLAGEEIDALVHSYDERALAELGAEDASYDILACPGLLAAPAP